MKFEISEPCTSRCLAFDRWFVCVFFVFFIIFFAVRFHRNHDGWVGLRVCFVFFSGVKRVE